MNAVIAELPPAILPGAARVGVLPAVERQDREALLVVLDVADAADRAPHLAAGGDPVAEAEGADRADHGIEQEIAEALAPLVDAAEARQRELARAADAHRVALQLRMAREHLRQRVVGRIERDLHRLHRRRAHRGGMRGAGERAEGGPELDVAQGAADRVELVPAEQLVERGQDRPAPARVRRVDGAGLRRRTRVVEDRDGRPASAW